MEEGFIKNLLTGIRQWVNGKIADINTAIEGKQDALTAGANIEITSGGTISATDTTYVASDFDIKDLADSTGLRDEWSGKQDALTAGDNIEIDSAGTISVTGITSATEQALEDMSLVISSNINELDGRVTAVESGKQDALTAGANIEIDSAGTISVTGIIDDSDVASGTTFSSSKIVELLGSISQFTVRVVNELPVTGETHVIYFVPAESGETSGSDVMNEYMWIENKWELIGNTRIDMSDYYTVEEVNTLLDEKLDIPDISVQDVLDELNQED